MKQLTCLEPVDAQHKLIAEGIELVPHLDGAKERTIAQLLSRPRKISAKLMRWITWTIMVTSLAHQTLSAKEKEPAQPWLTSALALMNAGA